MSGPSVASRRLEGTLVDGRYRVERAVGSGGFGVVYSAFHIGLGSPVAIKVLELREPRGPDDLATRIGIFLEEARTLKRLRHPNIVAALDVGVLPAEESGLTLPYIVMEWCAGPTMRTLLEQRSGQPMSLGEAWSLFAPVLAALEYAHLQGIAHRDLKPENILVDAGSDGSLAPRVIDFGIAKAISPGDAAGSGNTATASDRSPFTPRYAAPEQLAGARTGPWTDVHALGLIFVEMVTGRPAIDMNARLASISPVRPTPRTRGVDVGALEPVLQRALALRPIDRYPDAGALYRAMKAAADAGWPTGPRTLRTNTATANLSVPPSSRTEITLGARATSTQPSRARVRRFVLGAIAVLVLAGGAAIGFQQREGGGALPFVKPRLRDLAFDDLERRLAKAGFGPCRSYSVKRAGQYEAVCGESVLRIYDTLWLDGTSLGQASAAASPLAMPHDADKAGQFAIDGNRALIVVGPRDRVNALMNAALGDAQVELRESPKEPPPPPNERSLAAAKSLAAWNGRDLIASVRRVAGAHVMRTDEAPVPSVFLREGRDNGLVVINHVPSVWSTLESLKTHARFAYAIDGNNILVVTGSASYTNAEFVKRILAGAHAMEVDVYTPP